MKNQALYDLPQINFIWKDRKRILGMPISFTKYSLNEDRIFLDVGLISTRCDEVLLYRVRDISVTVSFWQRLFGVGTVTVDSTDRSVPHLLLKNIRHPRQVKELIHKQVEHSKLTNRVRISEFMGSSDPCGHEIDSDGDGIPDFLDND